jgi:hypothetical protein
MKIEVPSRRGLIHMRSVYLPCRDAAASEAQLIRVTLRRQQHGLAIYSNDEITS